MRFVHVCTILAALMVGSGVPVLRAQDEAADYPTASELFQQFMEQYSHQDYAEAKRTAERIDPVQLPSSERVTLYESIKQIDAKLEESGDPDAILDRADGRFAEGDVSGAVTLYKLVAGRDRASDDQRARGEVPR